MADETQPATEAANESSPVAENAAGTLFCGNCGAANPADMRFCGNCGKALVRVVAPQAPTPNPSPADGIGESTKSTVAATDEGSFETPIPSPNSPPQSAGEGASTAVAVPAPTPVSAVTPAAPPKPSVAVPTDPMARERERDRLLTLANVQRMRGQTGDARQTLQNALHMAEGKATAPIYELVGDLLASEEKYTDALAAYDQAHQADLARASAERKFATMTLRVADAKAERSIADAMLRGDSIADLMATGALESTGRGKRNAGMAMFLSMIMPGFGQFYNGQIVKGAILVGIFLADLLLIALTQDGEILTGKMVSILALSTGGKYVNKPFSPLGVFALIVLTGVWLYAIVDAPFMASKTSAMDEGGKPVVDKTGWEV